MTNGSVVLNGLTDKQLVTILEAKIKHEGMLGFSPQTMQQGARVVDGKSVIFNNNVILTWGNEQAYAVVVRLMAELGGHRLLATEAA